MKNTAFVIAVLLAGAPVRFNRLSDLASRQ